MFKNQGVKKIVLKNKMLKNPWVIKNILDYKARQLALNNASQSLSMLYLCIVVCHRLPTVWKFLRTGPTCVKNFPEPGWLDRFLTDWVCWSQQRQLKSLNEISFLPADNINVKNSFKDQFSAYPSNRRQSVATSSGVLVIYKL